MDGELILNPDALNEVARIIDLFCDSEIEIIENAHKKIKSLEDDWMDEETFENRVLNSIQLLKSQMSNVLQLISSDYPSFYRDRASKIIARPTFRGDSTSNKVDDNRDTEKSRKNDLKSTFEEIFEKTSKEIKLKIFTYLMRIKFIEPHARSCYYDPNGRTKRGLYKNIMAIDMNSPTFHQDLVSLTAQHIFFYMQRKNQLSIIESLNHEITHNTLAHETGFKKYVEALHNGKGIDFTNINVESQDYKTAMTFFADAFKEYVSDAQGKPTEMNRYFSHTYHRFVEILNNIEPMK